MSAALLGLWAYAAMLSLVWPMLSLVCLQTTGQVGAVAQAVALCIDSTLRHYYARTCADELRTLCTLDSTMFFAVTY